MLDSITPAMGRLRAWLDPEWLAFLGCALLLPLAALVAGDPFRAEFFLGLAIYLSVLKWLGWACLTRWTGDASAGLRWPAELFAGLALTAAYFYLRNLLGALWPAAYSLVELRGLFFILLAVHALGTAWTDRLRERLAGATAWIPFFLALALMFWEISAALEPQSSDPVFHAFTAKTYETHGMFFRGFNGSDPIVKGSAFGALNATTMAITGLSAVQVVNLQHPLWLAVAAWAIACHCGILLQLPLRILHVCPLVFLSLLPVHNLPHEPFYGGPHRQLAPAMMTALVLHAAFFPAAGRRRWTLNAWMIAFLCILSVALSPTCVPYAAMAFGAAVFLNLRAAGAGSVRSGLLHQTVAFAACGLVVLSCDQLYAWAIGGGPRAETALPAGQAGSARFSLSAGIERVLSESFFGFAREPDGAWVPLPDSVPGAMAVLVATCLALAWARMKRAGLPGTRQGLAWVVFSGATAWLGLKGIIGVLGAGMGLGPPDIARLGRYLILMQIRIELLLVLAVGLASVLFILSTLYDLRGRTALVLGILGLALLAVLPARDLLTWPAPPPRISLGAGADPPLGRVSREDLELVKWIDRNLPPEKGRIGLGGLIFPLHLYHQEKHLYPLGGAQAVPLYGRHLNFCFFQLDPSLANAWDDYVAHVRDAFDAPWCLANGIRFFYVSRDALRDNPGLAQAIRDGRLVPLRAAGDSTVYAVSPAPPGPRD